MTTGPDHADERLEIVDSRVMMRVFYIFATLAVLSAALAVGGKWLGRSIVLAGHSEDATLREIVIGNNVLAVPANEIRFETARQDGVADRLDLYLHWRDLTGYSAALRNAFNHAGGSREILFLTLAERTMSRDMSGRLEPIYRALVEPGAEALSAGLSLHRFTEASGYRDEQLVVGPGPEPFVARCLTAEAGGDSLAPCERDISLGEDLSLSYRFPRHLLPDWEALDRAVRAKANGYLRTVPAN